MIMYRVDKVKKLSRSEEVGIVRQAYENGFEFLGSGSSRAVFALDDKKVIKVALDHQGQRQNYYEAKFYEQAPHACAEVYAIGSHIIVCEKLEMAYEDLNTISIIINAARQCVDDSEEYYEDWDRDYLDYLDDEDFNYIAYRWDNGELKDIVDSLELHSRIDELQGSVGSFIDALSSATYYLGNTLDNDQIGFSSQRGIYVLYDAGFNTDVCQDKCGLVGDMDWYLDTDEPDDVLFQVVEKISRGKMHLIPRKIAC